MCRQTCKGIKCQSGADHRIITKSGRWLWNERSKSVTGFIRAKEVCELLQCSSAMAYRIIARLNEELESKGYITISGRISKSYLYERMGIKNESEVKENGETKNV